MQEFHSRRMHIPEPYPAVKAFLYYLYTDSIAEVRGEDDNRSGPTLADVGGMLTMASLYDMPRLRLLCINRSKEAVGVLEALVIGGGEVESNRLLGKLDAGTLLVNLFQVERNVHGGHGLVEVIAVEKPKSV